jgi:atypical dual specificity phosphatase
MRKWIADYLRHHAPRRWDSIDRMLRNCPPGLRRVVGRIAARAVLMAYYAFRRAVPTWEWFDQVDESILIGALPLDGDVATLERHNVSSILCLCREAEGPVGEYRRYGMTYLRVPLQDGSPPSREQLAECLAFIADVVRRKERVYVHCRFGRYRSALVVLHHLVVHGAMTPEDALSRLIDRRPAVSRELIRHLTPAEPIEQAKERST